MLRIPEFDAMSAVLSLTSDGPTEEEAAESSFIKDYYCFGSVFYRQYQAGYNMAPAPHFFTKDGWVWHSIDSIHGYSREWCRQPRPDSIGYTARIYNVQENILKAFFEPEFREE